MSNSLSRLERLRINKKLESIHIKIQPTVELHMRMIQAQIICHYWRKFKLDYTQFLPTLLKAFSPLSKSSFECTAEIITDVTSAFPELKGHLIAPYLQRNADTHTLLALGARGTHLGIETPWQNLFCAGDWVRHDPPPSFWNAPA